ncbi:MAG: hypothetical protein P1P90_06340 [Patescibacteria group bacterium]|nr:hypothetical protein [Patescibacteria group bacterium]
MKKLWDVHAGLHTEQIPELTEIKHLSDISQGQISVTLQDLASEAAELYKDLPDDERRVKMHEYLVTQMVARGAGEQAIDHALKTPKIDILNRRKHPEGESYREKHKSLEYFLRHYIELLNGKQGTASLAVTHGRTYIAIRQWLENFSDDMARILQKAEGPPFPPHGSMTFYKEEGGILVRQGSCYILAEGLNVSESHPRLLDFVEMPGLTPQKFEKICRIAGVKVKSPILQIPKRNEVGKMSHISYEKESSIPPAMPESGPWALTPTPPLPKVG